MGGRGSAATRNTDSKVFPQQQFKLTKSRFGKTEYESELFRIFKYSQNASGTSWKSSGYILEIKGQWNGRDVAQNFSTLKEAKSWLETNEAQEWYKTHRRYK